LAAYRHLLNAGVDTSRLIVGGDSAGGHLALMLLAKLCEADLPQPALVVGLSPWTDIGLRGNSQFGNDPYDLVQGYQTLLYGAWLKGDTGCSDIELSPIHQSFRRAAPIYLQAGGKEILVDMIRDFAEVLLVKGVQVRLDVWEHMNHEFHAYGDTVPQSQQAIDCIRIAMAWATANHRCTFPVSSNTVVDTLGVDSKRARPGASADSSILVQGSRFAGCTP
jgi:acetyl esterase/lipase